MMAIACRSKINNETLDVITSRPRWNAQRLAPCSRVHFSYQAHRTFFSIEPVCSHKLSLNRFKEIEIIPSILCNHNWIKLDSNSKKENGQFTYKWILYILIQIKEEVKEIRDTRQMKIKNIRMWETEPT